MDSSTLKPASELARASKAHFPNESAKYRHARQELLTEEIELRRHIERVAELRRALPPGGEVTKRYEFESEKGRVSLADLFGDKQTLIVYSYMFGPQRVSFVFIARSPIARLIEAKKARGWTRLKVCSDMSGEYTRDYVSAADADVPGYNVFTRRDGTVRHFWGGEMAGATADPGQDPRGAPDLDPLWTVLDTTPEGRGTDWYPKLSY